MSKTAKPHTRHTRPGWVKIRFSSDRGATAGLVVPAARVASSSVSDLSRLFPVSASRYMHRLEISPDYPTWEQAFWHDFGSGTTLGGASEPAGGESTGWQMGWLLGYASLGGDGYLVQIDGPGATGRQLLARSIPRMDRAAINARRVSMRQFQAEHWHPGQQILVLYRLRPEFTGYDTVLIAGWMVPGNMPWYRQR